MKVVYEQYRRETISFETKVQDCPRIHPTLLLSPPRELLTAYRLHFAEVITALGLFTSKFFTEYSTSMQW